MENSPVRSSADNPLFQSSRRLYLVLGLGLLLLVMGGMVYYFLITKRPAPPKVPPPRREVVREWEPIKPVREEVPPETNAAIAENILVWLNTQMNEEGFYNYGVRCRLDQRCERPDKDGRSGLGVLWAYFNHYQLVKDEADMPKIDYLLGLYTNEEKVDFIQNVFWNCKWMYSMWQADFFSEAQKEKIEAICFEQSDYYPLVEEDLKAQIKEGELRELSKIIAERGSPGGYIGMGAEDETRRYFIRFSAYVSDFVARYLWQGREEDLNEAIGYFYKAIDLWQQTPKDRYLPGKCMLGIGALDLYQATQDKAYLDFAQGLLEKEKIKEICLKESDEVSSELCDKSLLEKATCVEWARDLFRLTGEEEYQSLKAALLESLVNNNFDFPGFPGYVNGVGAFYETEFLREVKNLYYFVRENGLIAALLMEE